MQTRLSDGIQSRAEGPEIEKILRDCVHCGFCLATCPTYRLLGDENDSPRGRIYLLKQVMEGARASRLAQQHLDRCLACRACETSCPSGVRYGRLLDIGREIVDRQVERPYPERIMRSLLLMLFPYRHRFAVLMHIARFFKPLLPRALGNKIPLQKGKIPEINPKLHDRKVLLLAGCVQPVLAPEIDAAAVSLLARTGIEAVVPEGAGCCGALPYHLSDHQQALQMARKNIDACRNGIGQCTEAVIMSSSGCSVMLKSYAQLLQHDPAYAAQAAAFSAQVKDISEVLGEENWQANKAEPVTKVIFHSPCTLQHGQQITGLVENLLTRAGYELGQDMSGAICCGSAGVYSLLQPELSRQLKTDKLSALQQESPDIIATANIGCLNHLQSESSIRVMHWLELLK